MRTRIQYALKSFINYFIPNNHLLCITEMCTESTMRVIRHVIHFGLVVLSTISNGKICIGKIFNTKSKKIASKNYGKF